MPKTKVFNNNTERAEKYGETLLLLDLNNTTPADISSFTEAVAKKSKHHVGWVRKGNTAIIKVHSDNDGDIRNAMFAAGKLKIKFSSVLKGAKTI